MRIKKRLPILWKFFESKKKFKMYLRDIVQLESKNEIEYYSGIFFDNFYTLKKYHRKNPHLRFPQILQIIGLYYPGFFYHIEDDIMLIKLGVEPREVLYWGNNYSKNMRKLKNTNWILIKDMSTEHIKAILDGNFTNNLMYLKAFNNELKLRENV